MSQNTYKLFNVKILEKYALLVYQNVTKREASFPLKTSVEKIILLFLSVMRTIFIPIQHCIMLYWVCWLIEKTYNSYSTKKNHKKA